MKFTTAWEDVIKNNMHLKIMVATLLITSISLLFTTTTLALKPPVLIERGCYSKTPIQGDKKQTPIEYESFLKLALEQRFNTGSKVIEGYLSVKEKRNKEKEQQALKKGNLNQTIIVRNLDFKDSLMVAEIDRTYSVGNVRSTLPIKVKVTLETKDRTETNPYGLILVKTTELKEKKDKKQ